MHISQQLSRPRTLASGACDIAVPRFYRRSEATDAVNAAKAAAAADLDDTLKLLQQERQQHLAAVDASRQLARDAAQLDRVSAPNTSLQAEDSS